MLGPQTHEVQYLRITSSMRGAAVDKHFAIVSHTTDHAEGAALDYSMLAMSSWSQARLASILSKKSALTVQKTVHDSTYQMTVDLCSNGPAGLTTST
jgi:hypothetical protein